MASLGDAPRLLDTPAELQCPLTKQLLREPVLTTAGHVYERSAILEHLKLHDNDPVSGEPVSASLLTDVQYLRKRVESYRDATVAACVQLACSEECQEPLKYLRRALDLSTGRKRTAPGLTDEFAAYVRTHQSNVYDVYALQIFAKGLQSDGHPQLAARVVTKLLHMGEDKAQQAAIVKQWLALHAQAAGVEGSSQAAQLADFVRSHRVLTWSQTLDIMSEADVGLRLVAEVCKHLLADSAPACQGHDQHMLFLSYADLSLRCAEQRLRDLELSVVPDLQPEPLEKASSSDGHSCGRRSKGSLRAARLKRCLSWVAVGLTLETVASPSRMLVVVSQAVVVSVLALRL